MRHNARRPAGGGGRKDVESLARRAAGGDLEAARRLVRKIEEAQGVTPYRRLDKALEEARDSLSAGEIMDVVVSYVPSHEIAKRAPSDDGEIRRSYREDVEGVANELVRRVREREITDRDEFLERLHEEVDSHSRVIYTASAREALLVSDNGGYSVDNGLVDSSAFRDGIPWSQLAYGALYADVLEELRRRGFNVNDDDTFRSDDDEEDEEDEEDAEDEDDGDLDDEEDLDDEDEDDVA